MIIAVNIESIWDAEIMNAGYNGNIAPGAAVSFGFLGSQGDGGIPENSKVSTYTMEPYQGDDPEIDTDGDGLTDYYEYVKCGTNLLEEDTDGDGVLDPESDEGKDGFTNEEEMDCAADPRVADSDNDGLNDDEEMRVYGTDPLEKDTDQDGIADADEIVEQTFSQEIMEEEKPEVTKVSVSLATNGNIEHTASIANLYRTDKQSADLTDGDGQTDYAETGIVYTIDTIYTGNGKRVTVKRVLMASDSTRRDTDDDGQEDPEDKRPWTCDEEMSLSISLRGRRG